MRGRARWRLATLLAFLGVLVPATLWAHAHLVKSTPAANAQLTTPPDAIHLWFSEAPELAFTRIALIGPAGDTVPLRAATKDPKDRMEISVAIPTTLAAGKYTVSWRTAADDGHPTHGTFAFTVLPGTAAASAASGAPAQGDTSPAAASGSAAAGSAQPTMSATQPATSSASTAFDASSPLYVAVRAVSFVALLALLGAAAFYLLVLGALRSRAALDTTVLDRAARRAAWLGVGAAFLLLIAAVARLYAESYAVYGATGDAGMQQMRAMLGHTVWGWGWIAQAAAALIALLLLISLTRTSTRGKWMAAALAIAALAFTPALSGHAAASPHLAALAILIDGVHVIGAGGWLGTLLVVVLVGIPVGLTLGTAQRGRAIADLVNAFSPLALTFAGLTAVTGIANAWLRLGTLPALWESTYGRTLIVKLAILSLVIAVGAYNWRRARPALGDEAGARRIRRSATVELTIGLAVILVTAVLVATPTPKEGAGTGTASESVGR